MTGMNCCNSTSHYDTRRRWPCVQDHCASNWCIINHFSLADWCRHWLTERWWCEPAFSSDVFLLGCCRCRPPVILWAFWCRDSEYLFLSEQNDADITGHFHLSNYFEWLCLARQFASLSSGSGWFLIINISQGNVATYLRMDGIFNYQFTANSLISLSVKKCWQELIRT